MTLETADFCGQTIGGAVVRELLSNGVFCWVYKAVSPDEHELVLKIGKPEELIGLGGSTGAFKTCALHLISGASLSVKPKPEKLLALQATKLSGPPDPILLTTTTVEHWQDLPYLSMECLDGECLRAKLGNGKGSPEFLIELCRGLNRLSRTPTFSCHGDLKPENIIVTSRGIKLIDPGYFGPIECFGGAVEDCKITTPAYYPGLEPDDLFAFGLIAWETLVGVQPLQDNWMRVNADLSQTGETLARLIYQYEMLGCFNFSPLAQIQRPSKINPAISPTMESVLLKGLRLTFTPDGKVESAPGFTSFSDFEQALIAAYA